MRHQNCDMAPAVVGEGPKTWAYAKLLWDLEVDVEELAHDWCVAAVGEAAAPYAQAYFAWWEDFWAVRVPDTGWWQFTRFDPYFAFSLTDYLAAIEDGDLEHLRGLVDAMVSHAQTGPQQARAALIRDGLGYYDANVESYPRRFPKPTDDAATLTLATRMTATIDDRVAAARERLAIEDRHEADPVLRHRTDHRRYNHNWSGFNGTETWHLIDHLREHPAADDSVREHLQLTADGAASQAQRLSAFILDVADGTSVQRAVNPSFESGAAAPWLFINHVRFADGIGYGGGKGLRLAPPAAEPTRAREEAVVQTIAITPGLMAARLRYRVTSAEAEQGQLSLRIQLLNWTGSVVQTYQQPLIRVDEVTEDWTWISVCEDIPERLIGGRITQIKFVASLIRFDGTGEVHIDDAEVFTEQPLPAGALDPTIATTTESIAALGDSGEVAVTVGAAPLSGFDGTVSLELPNGWVAAPSMAQLSVPANAHAETSFLVTVGTTGATDALYEIGVTAGPSRGSAVMSVGEPAVDSVKILDTTSPSYAESGTWQPSSSPGQAGGRTRYAYPSQGAAATWTFSLAVAGHHRVSVWWPVYGRNTTAATYRIGDSDPITVDQLAGGGDWLVLGVYELEAGSMEVSVSGGDTEYLRADAVRVERVEPLSETAP